MRFIILQLCKILILSGKNFFPSRKSYRNPDLVYELSHRISPFSGWTSAGDENDNENISHLVLTICQLHETIRS